MRQTNISVWRAAALALIAAASGASWAQEATWGRTIGAMCVEGIPQSAIKIRSIENIDGRQVNTFDIRYDGGGQSRPLARVFRAPPTADVALARCSERTGDLLFEGDITSLKVTGARETAPGMAGATLRLDPDALDLEMVRTKSELAPLYGGRLELGADGAIAQSARTWIKNGEMVVAKAGEQTTGSLDITTWGRLLTGVKTLLPGTTDPTIIDFSAGNTNVIIRVPLNGGLTELRAGKLTAKDVPLAGSKLELPGANLQNVQARAGLVTLAANQSGATLTVDDLKVRAIAAQFSAGKTSANLTEASATIQTVLSSAPRSGSELTVTGPSMGRASASGTDCTVSFTGAELTRTPQCDVKSADAGSGRRRLIADAKSATSVTPAAVLGGAGLVQVIAVASSTSDEFNARFANVTAKLGAFDLSGQSLQMTTPVAAGARIDVPFSFELPPSKGAWKVRLPEGALAMDGILETLRLAGSISASLSDLNDWRIDIGQNKLAFVGRVNATYEPFIYGAKPQFGSVGLKFSSKTALRLSAAGATGTLLAGADVLTLADPVISLGDANLPLILKGPTKFDGAVELAYDLASGRATVDSGRLLLEKAELATVGDQPGELGEILIRKGRIAFDKLDAGFREGKGAIALAGLSVSAESVANKPRAADSTPGNQLAWSGQLETFRVGRIDGEIKQQDASKPLSVGNVTIRDAAIDLKDVRVGQGKALQFQGGNLAVRLTEYGSEKVVGSLDLNNSWIRSRTKNDHGFTEAAAPIVRFNVNVTGGPPNAPNGSGRLQTAGLSLNLDSKLEIPESCDGKPDFDGVPINAKVVSGPIGIDLSLEGSALKGHGAAIVTRAEVRDRGKYKCQAKAIDWPIAREQRAIYDYPCPTWSKPLRMCRGWTVIVPEVRVIFDRVIEVRNFYAEGFFTVVELTLDGGDSIKPCGKLGWVVPLADISYYVTPRTGIPVVNSIVKEVIDQTARPFTSNLVTSLGGLYGSIMPNVPNGPCLP